MSPVSHAEIGAYLLEQWGLTYPVVEAVAYHHTPERIVGRPSAQNSDFGPLQGMRIQLQQNVINHVCPANEQGAPGYTGTTATLPGHG